MKKILLLTAVFVLMSGFKAEAKTPDGFGFGIFYSSLSPHGSWIELEPGFTVWRPTIMRRWAPYQSGRWIWTSNGWYWDSYEPFGHITYHYGRWYNDDYYGWIWVPDYEWGPAWVEWRYDDDYIGWAPLPPYATFSINVGIVFTNTYYTPYNNWHYIDYGHFCDPYPYNYYVAEKHKYRIHGRTKYRSDYTYRNGGVYNNGVDVDYVRKRSGRDIDQRDLYRTSDERELRNSGGRNDEKIRTFVASREDLRKDTDGLRNANIERSDRKSSLLTSKVELGERTANRKNDTGRELTKSNGRDDERVVNKNDERQINKKRNDETLGRNDERQINKKRNDETLGNNTDRSPGNVKQKDLADRNKESGQTDRFNRDTKRTSEQLKKENTRIQKPDNDMRLQTKQERPKVEQNRQKNTGVEKNQTDVIRQKKDVRSMDTRKEQLLGKENRTDRAPKRDAGVTRNKDTRETVKQNPADTRKNEKQKSEREPGKTRQR